MKVGFAEREITPGPGLEMPGASRRAYHQGEVHDPCKVRVGIFDDGTECVVLVSVDAVIAPQVLVASVRQEIERRFAIPGRSIMVAATHSHSAGPLGFHRPRQFSHAPAWVQQLADEQSPCIDPGYLMLVHNQIVSAVANAWAGRAEASCGAMACHEPKAAFTRRFRMRNGLTHTFPGQGNPDIVTEAGPVDPEVGVLGAWDREGRLRGCIVNFACHLTTKPGGASADWVFYLEQVIRAGLGSDVVVVFLNGACGDIAPVDTMGPYENQAGERWTRRIGARVGAAAVRALLDIVPGAIGPVSALVAQLNIPRRRPSLERLEQARRLMREGTHRETAEWFFSREIILLDALIEEEPQAHIEVQAVQIGTAVLLACPGELFCELGLKLKTSTAFPVVFPVSLANGFCGYLPTSEAMSATGGGYETRLTSHSNLAIGAGEQIVDALAKLAGCLSPGPVPGEPARPTFRRAWDFGNVPAEC